MAMEEELPYIEEYLTDITIADARSPAHCEGYPVRNDCDCTRKVLRGRVAPELSPCAWPRGTRRSMTSADGLPTQWLGWRGQATPEEAQRNRAGHAGAD